MNTLNFQNKLIEVMTKKFHLLYPNANEGQLTDIEYKSIVTQMEEAGIPCTGKEI